MTRASLIRLMMVPGLALLLGAGCGGEKSCDEDMNQDKCKDTAVPFSKIVTELGSCITMACHASMGGDMMKNTFLARKGDAADICNVLKTKTPFVGGKFLDKDPMVAQIYKYPASTAHSGGQLYKAGDKGKADNMISWLKAGHPCP